MSKSCNPDRPVSVSRVSSPLPRKWPVAGLGWAVALTTCLFVHSAVAQSGYSTVKGISSGIPEGGLIAHKGGSAGYSCGQKTTYDPKGSSESQSDFINRVMNFFSSGGGENIYYCEYRDIPDAMDRRQPVYISIVNPPQTQCQIFFSAATINLYNQGGTAQTSPFNVTVKTGKRNRFTFYVTGKADYIRESNALGHVEVSTIGSTPCPGGGVLTFDVIDDDNSAYIGSLNAHPYRESWNKRPHCKVTDLDSTGKDGPGCGAID